MGKNRISNRNLILLSERPEEVVVVDGEVAGVVVEEEVEVEELDDRLWFILQLFSLNAEKFVLQR